MWNRRLKFKPLAIALGLCVSAAANIFAKPFSAPPEPIARVQAILINGNSADAPTAEQLRLKRANSSGTELVKVGTPLFKDDEMWTGRGVEASLAFENAADTEYHVLVSFKENSHGRIGSLWAFFGKFLVSGWGTFDTQTQVVRLGKRATEFYLEVVENGSVNLQVLRGEVEVEPVSGEVPGEVGPKLYGHSLGTNSRAVPTNKGLTVDALHGLEIKKGEPLGKPHKLENTEVETILDATDKLMVASLAGTPSNVIPTSYEFRVELENAPELLKLAAETAFVTARHSATLNPTAENIAKLGDAYKDLGAGKRAAKEYELAAKLNPALNDSVKFLSSQAEAYRLAKNFEKAAEKSSEAVKKSEAATANPYQKHLALNARGNLTYDLAIQNVAKGNWVAAGTYFKLSKTLFEAIKTGTEDTTRLIAAQNLLNVSLAINSDSALTPGDLSKYMRTYRGVLNFPGNYLIGEAVVVISGSRFSLIHCDETLTGSIRAPHQMRRMLTFNVVFDSAEPIKELSLKAILLDEKRIELSSAPGEKNQFTFSTSLTQGPLRCLQVFAFP
jgi:tetratricopeptide (TPR) repeat protein